MLSLVLNMLYAHASNIGGSVPLLFIILVAISRRFMNKERLQIAFSRLEPTQPAIRKLPRQLRMRLDRKNEAEWFRKEASVYTLQQEKKVHTKPIFIRTILKEHHRRLWILFYGTGKNWNNPSIVYTKNLSEPFKFLSEPFHLLSEPQHFKLSFFRRYDKMFAITLILNRITS